jgi:hypothetical protein|tara:strand:+ start:47 stop:454 length:408 start_codon:yes stop_codon:yes gene_type:complete
MEYLTSKMVEEKIGLSCSALNAQRKRGTGIPYTKIKGKIRYRTKIKGKIRYRTKIKGKIRYRLDDLKKYKNNYHAYVFKVREKDLHNKSDYYAIRLAVLKKKYPDYIEPPRNWKKKNDKSKTTQYRLQETQSRRT